MTERADRPSFELLMQAQDLLGQAREAERAAGNRGAWMVLNEMTISLFQIAIGREFDDVANAAYDRNYPNHPFPGGDAS